MAASATLNTYLRLIGKDQASGMFAAVGRQAATLHKRLARVHKSTQKLSNSMRGMAGIGVGLPAGWLVGRALQDEYAFDRAKQFFQGTADWTATTEAMKAFNDKLMHVAQNYRKTRQEMMAGAQEAITAGIDIKTITNTMEYAAKVSIAINEDLGKVYGDLTDIIKGGGMPFKTAIEQQKTLARVANVMAVAATTSNQTWSGFVSGLRHALPVTAMLGISLEKTTALLGVLADSGFKGEMGGTALRTMLIRLVKPTNAAQRALKAAGVTFRDMFSVDEKKLRTPELMLKRLGAAGLLTGNAGKSVREAVEKIYANPDNFRNLNALQDKLLGAIMKAQGVKKPNAEMIKYVQSAVGGGVMDAIKNMNIEKTLRSMRALSLPQFAEVMGVRRLPMAAALRKNLDDYIEKLKIIEKHSPGAINRRYMIMARGFAQAWDMASSAVNTFWGKVGASGIRADMTKMLNSVGDFINNLGTTDPDKVRNVAYGIAAIAAAGPGLATLRFLGSTFKPLFAAAGKMTALGAAAMFAVPKLFRFKAAMAGLVAMRARMTALGAGMLAMKAGVVGLAAVGVGAGIATLAANMKEIATYFKGFGSGFMQGWKDKIIVDEQGDEIDRIEGLNTKLKKLAATILGLDENKANLADFFNAGSAHGEQFAKALGLIVDKLRDMVKLLQDVGKRIDSLLNGMQKIGRYLGIASMPKMSPEEQAAELKKARARAAVRNRALEAQRAFENSKGAFGLIQGVDEYAKRLQKEKGNDNALRPRPQGSNVREFKPLGPGPQKVQVEQRGKVDVRVHIDAPAGVRATATAKATGAANAPPPTVSNAGRR